MRLHDSPRFFTSSLLGLAALVLRTTDGLAEVVGNSLPSDTPAKFQRHTDEFDYVKREEMIPMRDGVKRSS